MKAHKLVSAASAALLGLAVRGAAQAPVPVPVPAAPLGIAPGPAPPPAGNTIWSKLGISKQQLEYCQRHLCEKPLGQLLNNARAPFTALSGGLIGPKCPLMPSMADLADPGAVGAASQIKADELGAAKRRAAVRYLGTVDCHYWPEAEAALIDSLRRDRNECVRYEAALALGSGCCCTKKTVEALQIAATGSSKLGNPGETSERVKAAAFAALQHCLARQTEPPLPRQPERPPEPIRPPEKPEVQQARFITRAAPESKDAEVMQKAARTVAERTGLPPTPTGLATGHRNLFQIIRQARGSDRVSPSVVVDDDPVVATPNRGGSVGGTPDVQVLPTVRLVPAARPST